MPSHDPTRSRRWSPWRQTRASGSPPRDLRLHEQPDLMNSSGNEVHFLGFSWCGGLNEPASRFTAARDVASASGAAMVMRRALWDEFGWIPVGVLHVLRGRRAELALLASGLSRRVRAGCRRHAPLRVRSQPGQDVPRGAQPADHDAHAAGTQDARDADAGHRRGGARDARARLASGLGRLEVAGLGVARAPPALDPRARARALQSERAVPDSAIAPLLATRLMDANISLPSRLEPLDTALAVYWKVARTLLRQRQ